MLNKGGKFGTKYLTFHKDTAIFVLWYFSRTVPGAPKSIPKEFSYF